ncbi:uncharacterized protein LOC117574200 [Drosophila albomicans]|uniref:Uncharacterized protein LOC117574200 n=1 Tax=Drosophila albomicans TaxID=7291 RepID=A0A6P8XR58_DROAB|nr:uncharacterized protein LOC117574200 [Drosophila albomicans]
MKSYAIVVAMLLLVSGPLVSAEADQSSSSAKEQIVVHTPLQNYEQPSLRDYDDCQANRQSCLQICDGEDKCVAECPVCPELNEEPLLVQGINDTSYVPPAQTPINTTNIIRLTNEINNIINHDITARNELNVKVQQNVSQVGGRFGLGYNEQGSCCYVVRRERDCDQKEHCKEASRQRVCGTRCQARVMLAKRVVQCDKDQPDECHETLEYVPARKRNHSRKSSDLCRYSNSWPYVNCEAGQERHGGRVRRANCQSCLSLSYGFILQNGLPPNCYGCFQGYAAPMMAMPVFYPPYAYPNFGYNNDPEDVPKKEEQQPKTDDDFDLGDDDGWVIKTQKCRGPDGKLEDCHEGSGDLDNEVVLPPAHLEKGDDKTQPDTDYNVPAQRRRRRQSRRQFMRSIYSKRRDN